MVAEADIRGTAVWYMSAAETAEALTATCTMLAEQTLKPAVGRNYPLTDAASAHRDILTEPAAGKVILDCSSGV